MKPSRKNRDQVEVAADAAVIAEDAAVAGNEVSPKSISVEARIGRR